MDAAFLTGLLRELGSRVRREGLLTTGWKAVRYAIGRSGGNPRQDAFDRQRGIYTNRNEAVWQAGISRAARGSARKYAPVEPEVLNHVLAMLEFDPVDSTFLDLGCGKGRALVIAAEFAYRKVIGVELSAKLVYNARWNVRKLRLDNVEVIQSDASEVQFSTPNLTLFMYNPFGEEVMRRVAANIMASSQPPSHIIYLNPLCSTPLESMPMYRMIAEDPFYKIWRLKNYSPKAPSS